MLGLVTLFVAMATLTVAVADDSDSPRDVPEPIEPVLAAASGEGLAAIRTFKFPGLKCDLWAAEPDVGNIVALHRDYQGRMFVCETFRQEKGVEDNRRHAHWMAEELQAQSVQDRINYIKKYIPDAEKSYQSYDDRIRLVRDTDGDGKADKTTVFADHFNALEMGTGAGVLSYRNKVYYTCIPDLFMLSDSDGDDVADERTSLSTGYGVRFAFRGHDLHGLIVGPDGRLYFSIGDRGYNLANNLRDPESGAVFRCDLDGGNLEVFATGLRNPQELAFDEFGNLFTGDNNSDGGDEARWTYIVPGGDTGWRMYYQYLGDRGPWNRERIWDDSNNEKPAYVIPCIKNISDGPSGLEYYPGTGFGEDFNGRFFLCDFRGGPSNSGVRSFRNKPKGAFFELVDDEQPIWQTLLTDIDFGSDGKLYGSDWVTGWNGEDKGRIYAFYDQKHINSPIVKEVESLLREGLTEKATEELLTLLGHADQRVRQEAQFELVRRKDFDSLHVTFINGKETVKRLHAIWGMEQLVRGGVDLTKYISLDAIEFGSFTDTEVLRHLVRAVADHIPGAKTKIEGLCAHADAKVRYEAAMGLGKIGDPSSIDAITKLLVDNGNDDPIVRHGAIMAIRGIAIRENEQGESDFVDALVKHDSAAVRLATVVALRKQFEFNALNFRDSTYVVRLLARLVEDSDKAVQLESARAIHDLQMDDAMLPLAKLVQKPGLSDHLLRRAISANNRIGDADSAMRLGDFAAKSSADKERRVDALGLLGQWETPNPQDPVINAWREVDTSKRNVADAKKAMSDFALFLKSPDEVLSGAIAVAGKLGVKEACADIRSVVADASAGDATRASALSALEAMKFEGLGVLMAELETQPELPNALASVYADVLSRTSPEKAVKLIAATLGSAIGDRSDLRKKQKAIATLGQMTDDASAEWLGKMFADMDQLPPELMLDLLDAGSRRAGEIAAKATRIDAELAGKKMMADRYRWALKGGDADRGRVVFFEKTEVSCQRCHRIDGNGGKVGPNLSGVGFQYKRREILESIVDPNLKIAVGHGQVIVLDSDGLMHTGIVKEETEEQLALMDPDGKITRIAVDDIEDRKEGKSSMPEGLADQLSRSELRDLIEYLARRKNPVGPAKEEGHE